MLDCNTAYLYHFFVHKQEKEDKMKHDKCERCNTRHRPTRHHILPKVFFNGRGGIAHLCFGCHRDIERIILKAERIASGNPKIARFKLHESEYKQIYKEFICTASLH